MPIDEDVVPYIDMADLLTTWDGGDDVTVQSPVSRPSYQFGEVACLLVKVLARGLSVKKNRTCFSAPKICSYHRL